MGIEFANGSIYVLSTDGVSRFTLDGALLTSWNAPRGDDLAVAVDGTVYVSDYTRILKYSPDGTLLDEWDGDTIGSDYVRDLRGIVVMPDGNLLVAEYWLQHIMLLDSTNGDMIKLWDENTTGYYLYFPWGISIAPNGDAYVAESGGRVTVIRSGIIVEQWLDYSYFDWLKRVAVDGDGNVFVLDEHTVKKYASESVPTLPVTWGKLKAKY